MYTHNPNRLITVPADVLPPNAARPSADRVMTIQVHMFCSKYIWLSMITYHLIGPDDIMKTALQSRYNDHDGISNHQPHLTSRLFAQAFIHALIKENIKAPRHWPLWGEFTGTGEFPIQRASNAENVFIWWCHHGPKRLDFNSSLFINALQGTIWKAMIKCEYSENDKCRSKFQIQIRVELKTIKLCKSQ